MGLLLNKDFYKSPTQLMKIAILFSCGIFTVFQVNDCVLKLIHPPISTYYHYTLNDTMRYPYVTICRENPFKKELFTKFGNKAIPDLKYYFAFENFDFENYTLSEFVQNTTYEFNEIFMQYGYAGAGDTNVLRISHRYHLNRGRCFTIKPKKQSSVFSRQGGYMFALRTVKNDVDNSYAGFEIYLHDRNEILTSKLYQKESFLEHISLDASEEMNVRLDIKEFGRVPSTDNHCSADPNYSRSKCQESCISVKVASKVNCTAPWLYLPPNHTYKECNDYNSVRALIKDFVSSWEAYRQLCDCPKVCNFTIYSTSIVRRTAIDKENAPNSIIRIYYDKNLITTVCEVVGYDWSHLISDIGGSLGFLLGLSVVSVVYIAEEVLRFVFKLILRRRFAKEQRVLEQSNGVNHVNNEFEYRSDCQATKEYMNELNIYENMFAYRRENFI